jgi:hypothetical protein
MQIKLFGALGCSEIDNHLFAFPCFSLCLAILLSRGISVKEGSNGTPSNCHVFAASLRASLNEAAKYSAKLGCELDLFEASETLAFFLLSDFPVQDFDE